MQETTTSLRGRLLVSSGGLFDPNFRHTVVLVGEHNEDGALGVVLNRAADVAARDAVPDLADLLPPGEPVFQGGPVQPEGVVLLADCESEGIADIPVLGSIGFVIGEIAPETRQGIVRARVFAGYSGWGPGQLETEMAQDSWIVSPAQPEDVFTDNPDLLWSRVLQRLGPEYRTLSRMPFDPSMN
jgi:putative transcriptional regulator